jgi:hypothetical protein
MIRTRHGKNIAVLEPDASYSNVDAFWLDSQNLLMIRQMRRAADQRWSIWHLDTQAEDVLGVFNEPQSPNIAPDARWLVIQPNRDASNEPQRATVFQVAGEITYTLDELSLTGRGWSPDSQWYAAAVRHPADNQEAFQILNIATGTIYDYDVAASTVVWSNDSQFVIAYNKESLAIFRAGALWLRQSLTDIWQVLWSEDSRYLLLIITGEQSTFAYHLIDTQQGTNMRLLTTLPDKFRRNSTQWTTDSTAITYLVDGDVDSLYEVDIATRRHRHVYDFAQIDRRVIVRLGHPDFINRP